MTDKKFKYGAFDQTNKGECLLDLVIGFVYTNRDPKEIPYIGESKSIKLSDSIIKKVYQFMEEHQIYYKIIFIPPKVLDSTNLNDILVKEQQKLAEEFQLENYSIDSHYQDPRKLLRIHKAYNPKPKYKIENQLDSYDPLVGLASIVSKIAKNEMYKNFEKQNGAIGSGNLNDNITRNYIKKNWPIVPGLRKKWNLSSLLKKL